MTDMKEGNTVDTLHKQWDEILCPICMDHPHNAVLIMCGSHDKGCRSYICDTSYRHSNCLDRFKKLRTNITRSPSRNNSSFLDNSDNDMHGERTLHSEPLETNSSYPSRSIVEIREDHTLDEQNNASSRVTTHVSGENNNQNQNVHWEARGVESMTFDESTEGAVLKSDGTLKCPLCRGMVLGWEIAKDVRQYLDLKPRSCSGESCSFLGNYRELRRHARRIHPASRPADVDPSRQRAWRRMEHQREYGDILSAIRSAMPDAIVFGDYVIESGDGMSRDREVASSSSRDGPWWTTFFLFHMISNPFGSLNESRSSSRAWRRHRRSSGHRYVWGESLLGLHGDDDDRRDFESDDNPAPRRRRRITRSRTDEELPWDS